MLAEASVGPSDVSARQSKLVSGSGWCRGKRHSCRCGLSVDSSFESPRLCIVLDDTHSNERADEQFCRKDMLTTAVVGPGKVRAVTRDRFGRTGLLWRLTNGERSTCVFTRRVDAKGFFVKGSMDWRGTTLECSPPPSVATGFAFDGVKCGLGARTSPSRIRWPLPVTVTQRFESCRPRR